MYKFISKLFVLSLFTICTFSFISCNDDDNKLPPPPSENSETNLQDANTGITFNGNAVILGISGKYSADIVSSLNILIPNQSGNVDENTDLLIIPELSDAFKNEIETVYRNGGIIAITNPSSVNISQWQSNHNWASINMIEDADNAIIYSFNNMTHHCIVSEPNHDSFTVDRNDVLSMSDKNDEDFFFKNLLEPEEEVKEDEGIIGGEEFETSYKDDEYNNMYTYLSHWVSMMNDDKNKAEEINTVLSRSGITDNVANIFRTHPYGTSYPFSAEHIVVRKCGGNSKPDRIIPSNGSINASFDIYQIHCYENQPGKGDYYLVSMTASVASKDMYKGRWWHKHGLVCVRLCGFFAKSFEVECTPVDASNEALSTETVYFTANGYPSPSTTIGCTNYTRSVSESFNMGASGSGGYANNSPKLEGEISFSAGCTWSESESRPISDTDIENFSTGNVVRYILRYNNLPYFKWTEYRGFYEGNSRTYRSTSELRAYWIWYVPNAKDDSNEAPLNIRFRAKANYGALSFYTSDLDLKEKGYTANYEKTFKLDGFTRDRCGGIVINNNFKKATIKNIQIYNINDSERKNLLWESKETIIPGKEKKTPAFKIKDKYMIYLTTTDNKEYVYSTYSDGLSLELGEYINVYSATDFKRK